MPDESGRQAGAEVAASVCFAASTLAAIVLWAKQAMPHDEVTEHRSSVASTEEEVEAFAADFDAGKEGIGRRRLLFGLAASAFTAMGVALLFPLRSLGPRPGKGLKTTPYA